MDLTSITTQVGSMTQNLDGMTTAIVSIGTLLFGVSKAVSNGRAGPIVKLVQGTFDIVAALLIGCGTLLQKCSKILAGILKSDGYAGKK